MTVVPAPLTVSVAGSFAQQWQQASKKTAKKERKTEDSSKVEEVHETTDSHHIDEEA